MKDSLLMEKWSSQSLEITKNYVPDKELLMLNLVISGHVHDCKIRPEQKNILYMVQPSSSLEISLKESEVRPKHIGLLRIFSAILLF